MGGVSMLLCSHSPQTSEGWGLRITQPFTHRPHSMGQDLPITWPVCKLYIRVDGGVWSSGAAVAKYHKLGGLKQQNLSSLSSRVPNSGVKVSAEPWSPQRLQGRIFAFPLPEATFHHFHCIFPLSLPLLCVCLKLPGASFLQGHLSVDFASTKISHMTWSSQDL